MRAIDADALMKEAERSERDNPHTDGMVRNTHVHEHRHFIAMIGNAPTIEVEPKWIPVAERLPEEWWKPDGEMVNYLIFAPEFGVDIGNYLAPAKTWLCVGIPCSVTHWKPLPKGPKEDGGAE